MANIDMWPVIHSERKSLAADLDGLTDQQWSTQSLCDQWTVREALAHMAATTKITPASFFAKMAGTGFSFGKLQAKGVAAELGDSAADTLADFQAQINSVKHPPGPAETMLGETLVHGEDIRRPLDIKHAYPTDSVIRAADFYSGSNLLIGSKRRIAGLVLKATDTEWTHGTDGPEVRGPVISLLMAMTGRNQAIADLSGDGVEILRGRP